MTREDTCEVKNLSHSWFQSSWLVEFSQQKAIVNSVTGATGNNTVHKKDSIEQQRAFDPGTTMGETVDYGMLSRLEIR